MSPIGAVCAASIAAFRPVPIRIRTALACITRRNTPASPIAQRCNYFGRHVAVTSAICMQQMRMHAHERNADAHASTQTYMCVYIDTPLYQHEPLLAMSRLQWQLQDSPLNKVVSSYGNNMSKRCSATKAGASNGSGPSGAGQQWPETHITLLSPSS